MSGREKFGLTATAILAVLAGVAIRANVQVHASAAECTQKLAGDELISSPIGAVNHAITIHRPPSDVWPWIAQMGSGRAGWYAYDFIDNGGHRSADRRYAPVRSRPAVPIHPDRTGGATLACRLN